MDTDNSFEMSSCLFQTFLRNFYFINSVDLHLKVKGLINLEVIL